MGDNRITGVFDPAFAQDVSTKIYADNIGTWKIVKAGDVMSNNLDMNLNITTDVDDPVSEQDLVTTEVEYKNVGYLMEIHSHL